MDFGLALKELKNGNKVAREGWNGKGMFVVKQIPCKLEGLLINRIQSLPESAKKLLFQQEGVPVLEYTNQMLIINSSGRADSWVPSSSDVFAEDWMVVEQ